MKLGVFIVSSTALPKRMTRQRRLVLHELRKLKNHPSADYLFGIVRQTIPNISLGTVYRNLDVLVNSGLALKLDLAGGQSRYDGDISPHYHIRCRACGAVDDLPENAVIGVDSPRVLESSYVVTGWRMEFDGFCPMCQLSVIEPSQLTTTSRTQFQSVST
jgi:Fur family ferric uptake transcriptional regulator